MSLQRDSQLVALSYLSALVTAASAQLDLLTDFVMVNKYSPELDETLSEVLPAIDEQISKLRRQIDSDMAEVRVP